MEKLKTFTAHLCLIDPRVKAEPSRPLDDIRIKNGCKMGSDG